MKRDYHLLLVGTDVKNASRIVRSNLQISILIEERTHRSNYPSACQLYVVDFDNIDACVKIASKIHNNHPVDTVLSFNEKTVLLSARIVDSLGVFGNALNSVEFAINKAKMRGLLNETSLFASVKYQVVQFPGELHEVSSQLPFPVISKPIDGTGSKGVSLLRSTTDLHDYIAYLEISGYNGPLIIEEYVEGPEYSVEAFSYYGQHVIIGVTQKQTTGSPHFIETGHIFPAPISEKQHVELTSCALELLSFLNHQIGVSHTELILTQAGPVIVETHMRPPGDRIPELILLTTGVDVYDLTVSSLIEGRIPLCDFSVFQVAATDQIILPEGKLVSTNVHEKLRSYCEVAEYDFKLNPGDSVNRVINSRTRHGNYVYSAKNYEELSHLSRELADSLIFQIVNLS